MTTDLTTIGSQLRTAVIEMPGWQAAARRLARDCAS